MKYYHTIITQIEVDTKDGNDIPQDFSDNLVSAVECNVLGCFQGFEDHVTLENLYVTRLPNLRFK